MVRRAKRPRIPQHARLDPHAGAEPSHGARRVGAVRAARCRGVRRWDGTTVNRRWGRWSLAAREDVA